MGKVDQSVSLEHRVIAALRKMGFEDSEIHLETTASGKVGGYIVSRRFERQPHEERQETLWVGLGKLLAADELRQIVAVLTMAPLEVADDPAA